MVGGSMVIKEEVGNSAFWFYLPHTHTHTHTHIYAELRAQGTTQKFGEFE